MKPGPVRGRFVRLPRILGAALLAAACSDAVSPTPPPQFSFSPNGITLRTDNGAMNYTGRLIRKGFDHRDANQRVIHPLPGDAVVATFYWIGAPNIIDSVSDVYTDAQLTPIGNSYHLVAYVQARGINMATYVATNVQFDSTRGYVFAVQATFRDTISIGGVKMVDWTGVEDVYPTALGAFHSDSVSAPSPTPVSPGPITIGAGSIAYGVSLSNGGVNIQPRPAGWTNIGGGIGSSPDGRLQDNGDYLPPGGGGTINPQWTWDFQRPSTALATVLELKPGTSASGTPAGNLSVTTSTTGSSPDADGYTVRVDGGTPQPVGPNETVVFSNLPPGNHAVTLTGVASNCGVDGTNPQTVTVSSGSTTPVDYSVSCTAPNVGGITLDREMGGLNQGGQVLQARFAPNPHLGDAIVATFYWLGSTNIVDSVTDVLTDAGSTRVGNQYHLVEYVGTGGVSMATFVATNVRNFADTSSDPGRFLVVRAHLSQSVIDGGVKLSAWRGVGDVFAQTLGAHQSASGTGTTPTVADPGSITVGAGALTYAVTMSNGVVGLDPPPAPFAPIGGSGSDASIKEDSRYLVAGSGATVNPRWTWQFNSPSSPRTWLATVLALNPPAPASSGNLTVTAATTGSNVDADGYTVTVDGGSPQAIGINASVSYPNLASGNHTVSISGVAANCTVSGGTSQTVTVPSGGTVTAAFSVTCSATSGDLTVTASTTGSSLDPDGYSVAVDGGTAQPLGINGSVTFTGLGAGTHSVVLSGVAANCTVSGGTSHTVTVPAGGTATTTFTVSCVTPPGNLTVSTSTSGSSLDPDGYTVTVDGGSPQLIGINGSVSYPNLSAGNHTVAISGVSANCTVSGGSSQTVAVPSGGTANASFSVSCSATTGDLIVTASTSGSSLDADGYTVTVDGGATQALAINGSVTFTGLGAGTHSVVLSGVATNCTVSGGTSQTVTVPAGGTATTTFTITCVTPSGNLTVSTSTTGSSLDPDGYTVTVDGGSPQAIGINASVTYTSLAPGNHTVAISGVAGTCTVSGGTSRTVNVPSGGTATTTFTVTCATPPGNLTVSTSTTGSSLDSDGYTVTVDGGSPQAMGINASVTYTNLTAGNHNVAISGVAGNCTVSGGTSRTVSVPSGGTATTTFTVTCATPSGNLTVSASTTGSSLDPDGYTVAVDGGTGQALAINGSVTFTGLAAGSHNVVLSGVAGTCTVSGGTSQTITVPSGGTATTTFTVTCSTPPGNLTVSTSTTGSSLDADGYTITVDGGSPQSVGINASVTYTNLTAGNHTVAISGVAGNCTVTGGTSRTVSVPSGGTATTTFTVTCVTPPGNLTVSTSTTGSSLDPDGYTITVDGGSPQSVGINASVSYTNLTPGNHTVAISGVAGNCTVSGSTSRTVSVPSGGTATTTFTVTCVTPPGNLTVSTSTTGSSLDPDGYTITVDGGSPQSVGINASVTYTNLAAGNHTVAISGVAGNCTVSGSTSRTVSVPSGGTATTTFTVSCVTPPGNLTVSTSTTGSSLDPDGYTITVDGGSPQSVGINASVTYTNLSAGSHTVAISGVAGTCTVSGGTSRSVTVPSGGTATTTFSVTCTTPNSPPVVNAGADQNVALGVLYTLNASFSDPDNGPWSYTIDWGDGSTSTGNRSTAGSFSATHTYLGVLTTRTIRVTVADSQGASGSDTKVVTLIL